MALVLLAVTALLLADSACAGCGRWVVRETTDYLDDPAFDALAKSAQVEDSAVGQNQSEGQSPAEPSARDEPPIVPDPDPSGKWSLQLNGTSAASIELILMNTDGRVGGYGNLTEGGSSATAMVSGTMSAGSLSLQVRTNGSRPQRIYQLDLQMEGDSLTGSYVLTVGGIEAGRGGALGGRSAS